MPREDRCVQQHVAEIGIQVRRDDRQQLVEDRRRDERVPADSEGVGADFCHVVLLSAMPHVLKSLTPNRSRGVAVRVRLDEERRRAGVPQCAGGGSRRISGVQEPAARRHAHALHRRRRRALVPIITFAEREA